MAWAALVLGAIAALVLAAPALADTTLALPGVSGDLAISSFDLKPSTGGNAGGELTLVAQQSAVSGLLGADAIGETFATAQLRTDQDVGGGTLTQAIYRFRGFTITGFSVTLARGASRATITAHYDRLAISQTPDDAGEPQP